MTDPLVSLVLNRLVERGGTLVLDDAGLNTLIDGYGAALTSGRASEATSALLELALFLDEKKGARAAAHTLITLCLAAGPALRELGDATSAAAAARVADAQRKLTDFTGDERVQRVLDSGTRPEGTVAASPLARFQLKVPPRSTS